MDVLFPNIELRFAVNTGNSLWPLLNLVFVDITGLDSGVYAIAYPAK